MCLSKPSLIMAASSVIPSREAQKQFSALTVEEVQVYIEDGLTESQISRRNEQAVEARQLKILYTALTEKKIRGFLENGFTKDQISKLNEKSTRKTDKILAGRVVRIYDADRELNLLLLGRTGEGKSATGNLIVGEQVFHESSGGQSCTPRTQEEACKVEGNTVHIVDSPGLFDTKKSHEEIFTELAKIVDTFSEGIDGFLFVLSMGNPRFTKEQQEVFEMMEKDMFGVNALHHCFVILTSIESKEDVTSINDWIDKQKDSPLGDLLNNRVKRRVIAVNNKEKSIYGREVQRQQIIRMVIANTREMDRFSPAVFKQIQMEKMKLEKEYPLHLRQYAAIIEKEISLKLHFKTYSEIKDMVKTEQERIAEDVFEKVMKAEGVQETLSTELHWRVKLAVPAKIKRLIDEAKWKQNELRVLLGVMSGGLLVMGTVLPDIGIPLGAPTGPDIGALREKIKRVGK